MAGTLRVVTLSDTALQVGHDSDVKNLKKPYTLERNILLQIERANYFLNFVTESDKRQCN